MAFNICRNILRQRPKLLQFSRKINLQEYQSKILMHEYDLTIQDFRLATSVEEAETIIAAWKPPAYVLKAQIQAGGRKLGHFAGEVMSGIQLTANPADVPFIVSKMLGRRLITKQTQPEGIVVHAIMIAEAISIKKERYLAIILDQESVCPVVITSAKGGISIEEIAASNPEAIHKEKINMDEGITNEKATKIALSMGFPIDSAQFKACCNEVKRLYQLFIDLECLQVEVNPFGESEDGRLVNMDAKFEFDSNATYRQPRVAALSTQSRKLDVEAAGIHSSVALEVDAEAHGLTYIGLHNGYIGCIVNGAGLAMATMDLLELYGGRAANFLDLGGRANQADVEFAIKTISKSSCVRCILINIFGGIVNTRMVAEGIVKACRQSPRKLPIVIRLEGTDAVEGRQVISEAGLNFHVVHNMDEAARISCELSH